MSSDSTPRTAAEREHDFRLLHPQEAETVYRWLPLEDDCIRHHGPHKGFRCNGAIGRLIEVREAEASPAASGDALRCDRIVNNGMGEPTECGRTLPCEYHPAPLPEGLDVPDFSTLTAVIEDTPPDIIRSSLLDSGEGLAGWIINHWAEYASLASREEQG